MAEEWGGYDWLSDQRKIINPLPTELFSGNVLNQRLWKLKWNLSQSTKFSLKKWILKYCLRIIRLYKWNIPYTTAVMLYFIKYAQYYVALSFVLHHQFLWIINSCEYIEPYYFRLLHWHKGNYITVTVIVKQPWRIWAKISQLKITTEHNDEKLLRYTIYQEGSPLNSLWPCYAIWRHRSGSTLAQVMAWCPMAPSHYLNQCWIMISEVLWHSHQGNVTGNA